MESNEQHGKARSSNMVRMHPKATGFQVLQGDPPLGHLWLDPSWQNSRDPVQAR